MKRLRRDWQQSPRCTLTLDNAGEWVQAADGTLAFSQGALEGTLLHSDALRERLAQGGHEPFIAGLLGAATPPDLAEYLAQTLGSVSVAAPEPADLLVRYLAFSVQAAAGRLRPASEPSNAATWSRLSASSALF